MFTMLAGSIIGIIAQKAEGDQPLVVFGRWGRCFVADLGLSSSSLPPPPTGIRTLKNAIIAHLAQLGGGSRPPAIVAPNTGPQFVAVVARLKEIELHPWFQVSFLLYQVCFGRRKGGGRTMTSPL